MPEPKPQDAQPDSQSSTREIQEAVTVDPQSLPIRKNLPILWADYMKLSVRAQPSVCILQFFAAMADEQMELCRLMVTSAQARRIAAAINDTLDKLEARAKADAKTAM